MEESSATGLRKRSCHHHEGSFRKRERKEGRKIGGNYGGEERPGIFQSIRRGKISIIAALHAEIEEKFP